MTVTYLVVIYIDRNSVSHVKCVSKFTVFTADTARTLNTHRSRSSITLLDQNLHSPVKILQVKCHNIKHWTIPMKWQTVHLRWEKKRHRPSEWKEEKQFKNKYPIHQCHLIVREIIGLSKWTTQHIEHD